MGDSIVPIIDPAELLHGASFQSVSSYKLVRRLGQGGMGDVWLAERSSAGRHVQKVAVKFLRGPGSGHSLAEEALRMSYLTHDNIVPFVDSGHDNRGRFFVAMSYIEGSDLIGLRSLVGFSEYDVFTGRAQTRIPDPLVGFIMFMVLRALHYAHTFEFGDGVVGLVHRDVSPGNILLAEAGGFVKLTDFGVAVPQESGSFEIAGKVPYMSPEVITGEQADARADIYSLGIVAYELLTGFNPNVHPRYMTSVIAAITNYMLSIEQPLRPPFEVVEGVDPGLSDIVLRMLSADPNERYPSAEDVLVDLTKCLFSSGVGPTAGSLDSYIKVFQSPGSVPDRRMRRTLSFLATPNGDLEVAAPWRLTERARQDFQAGKNPARVT